jgi:ribulose-5-phosphate 4-epimerase/fuculose-1-phosphate aldolase
MSNLENLIADLVTANRILANENVVDAFGHVSVRHPVDAGHYLMSCAKSPELVAVNDIMEFDLEGVPIDSSGPSGRKPYLERFIHGALYEARPDIKSVVHNHSRSVIPFSITEEKLKPVMHSCATIGYDIPVWDAQNTFGDTDLLVSNMLMGRDLARVLGGGACALMRGHGCTVAAKSLREAVYTAVYLEVNAELQWKASHFGKLKFLSSGEIERISSRLGQAKPGEGYDRSWEYWSRRSSIAHIRR